MTENIKVKTGRDIKQDRAGVTRDQIVTAAFECIRDLGYARTTMELIAARAKCTRGGVAYHFGSNKSSVTLAVAAMLSDRLLAVDLRDTARGKTRKDRIVTALHKAADVYSGEESLVLLDIWVGCRTDPEMREKLAHLVTEMNDKVVERWLQVAKLDKLTPEEQAYRLLFRAAMRGLMVERILHGPNSVQKQAILLLIDLGGNVSS